MSLSDWYSLQWARGRRGRDTATASTPHPNSNGGIDHLLPLNDINGNATARDRKALEPLFGPNIGAVTSGPAWTAVVDKKVVTDELTPDVLQQPLQPTTTLQALVNLKRPSIRLSPLAPLTSASAHHLQHSLEFEYDCDAPKVGIHIHVFLPKNHPDAPPGVPPHHPHAKLLIFEAVVEAGFNRRLTLDDGAVIELARFEKAPTEHHPDPASALTLPPPEADYRAPTPVSASEPTSHRHRRRFTQAFRFRKPVANRTIAGPALAVVDAQPTSPVADPTPPAAPAEAPVNKPTIAEEDGVKITIKLVALDEQGTELAAPNEQVTYLHVVRVGPPPAPKLPPAAAEASVADAKPDDADAPSTPQDAAEEEEEEEPDTRPWVVKVVKREATIGPHTFHLHEIFGLSSTTTSAATPPPAATPAHSNYPPIAHEAEAEGDVQTEECLLCLSSPREVVLLPCRHLVACKECALNMVEFGAGGNITQTADDAGVGGDAVGGAANAEGNAAAATVAAPTVTTTTGGIMNQRRKRKAKGWFCPVCRQPYTSLLRITTAPPLLPVGTPNSNSKLAEGATATTAAPAAAATEGATEPAPSGGGLLGNLTRPAFLRSFTGGRTGDANANPAGGTIVMADVESRAGLGRVGS
ncbi:hypothetical protein FA15DRAFT_755285 [Coprinopsis marcescibilis]|uniref:RING-type domain-containing protein n=1 Tax=Coprinopsis marcescibilis TaxID=230819 RepID=A0A5C3KZL6_COPMA|nr:hypothetical protein FA15DRAFT_755285 [Coprinopsis marcescibilis]